MSMFARILFLDSHLDASARVLRSAMRIAADFGASLTVAGVVPDTAEARSHGWEDGPGLSSERWCETVTSQLAAGRPTGLDTTVKLLRSSWVPRAAHAHDLVVTAAAPESLRWPLRYAATERAVIRAAGRPVWILHPAQESPTRVVMAGVDVSKDADEDVARSVVRTAADAAEAAHARLVLVHAWSVIGESLIASRSRSGDPRGLRRILRQEKEDRRARLERVLALEGIAAPREIMMPHGLPVPMLERLAWRGEVDVVVVGASEPRTRLGLLAFPPTAEQLLGRVFASVLVV